MPTLSNHDFVTAVPAASPADAAKYFEGLFAFEADCWDVHDAMTHGVTTFTLLDVRSPGDFQQKHVPGAINLPHALISERTLAQFPADTMFVTYCAGPHCNGADKGALKIAKLGRPVKKMIGGITGWEDEGFDFETG